MSPGVSFSSKQKNTLVQARPSTAAIVLGILLVARTAEGLQQHRKLPTDNIFIAKTGGYREREKPQNADELRANTDLRVVGRDDYEFLLGNCEGDCDSNKDCLPGLRCFQRKDASQDEVAGCTGRPKEKVDYCIDPEARKRPTLTLVGDEVDYRLGKCEGDCDKDADCMPGLECFKKEKNISIGSRQVPGCEGEDLKGVHYCFDPDDVPMLGRPDEKKTPSTTKTKKSNKSDESEGVGDEEEGGKPDGEEVAGKVTPAPATGAPQSSSSTGEAEPTMQPAASSMAGNGIDSDNGVDDPEYNAGATKASISPTRSPESNESSENGVEAMKPAMSPSISPTSNEFENGVEAMKPTTSPNISPQSNEIDNGTEPTKLTKAPTSLSQSNESENGAETTVPTLSPSISPQPNEEVSNPPAFPTASPSTSEGLFTGDLSVQFAFGIVLVDPILPEDIMSRNKNNVKDDLEYALALLVSDVILKTFGSQRRSLIKKHAKGVASLNPGVRREMSSLQRRNLLVMYNSDRPPTVDGAASRGCPSDVSGSCYEMVATATLSLENEDRESFETVFLNAINEAIAEGRLTGELAALESDESDSATMPLVEDGILSEAGGGRRLSTPQIFGIVAASMFVVVVLACYVDRRNTRKLERQRQAYDEETPLETPADHIPEPTEFEPSKARLRHMVVVGHTTPTTAKIWAQVPNPGTWSLILSKTKLSGEDGGLREAAQSGNSSENENTIQRHACFENNSMLNHCFHFADLEEGTRYFYALLETSTGSLAIGGTEDRSFKTAKSSYRSIKLAAYSCHDPYSWEAGKAYTGAWPILAKNCSDLDLTIGSGDQVYVDSNEIAMTDLWVFLREHKDQIRQRFIPDGDSNNIDEIGLREFLVQLIRQYYMIYWNFADIWKVFGSVPSYMMWDDHEIMDGWGSLNVTERLTKIEKKGKFATLDADSIERVIKLTWEAAAQVYEEYQHSHNPGPEFKSGVDDPSKFIWDYSFAYGSEYRFFAMDMRGGHNVEFGSDRLLGSAQHNRFKEWCEQLDASVKVAFVVSPVPVVHWSSIVEYAVYFQSSLKDDLMDAWQHPTNHDERTKMLDALLTASHRLKIPICIISGDVHCISAYTLTDKKRFPDAKIVQITASAISRKPVPSFGTKAFAKTGYMKTRLDDGKGKNVTTSVHCKYHYGKAGVTNFAILGANGSDLDATFYWVGKNGKTGIDKIDFSG